MQLSSTILLSIIHTFSNEYLPKHTLFLTNDKKDNRANEELMQMILSDV